MRTGISKKAGILLPVAFLAGAALLSCFLPDTDISRSERRHLAQRPRFSTGGLLDGSYMKEMDLYLQEQFVGRDFFRGIKAELETSVFGKADALGYYEAEGNIYKLDGRLNEKNVIRAAEKFSVIAESYFPDAGVYVSMIPDKNYYAKTERVYPILDYERMEALITETMPKASYLSIRERLVAEDYYRTDLHWRQECILDISDFLVTAMNTGGKDLGRERRVEVASENFLGGYAGASGFWAEPEELNYVTEDGMEKVRVYDYEKGEEVDVYAWERMEQGVDPYDFFLWGPRALLTIKNPMSDVRGKKLILFRDSFGSSIAPLLSGEYEEVTLVDLRYITMEYAAELLGDMDYDDVLFLYSQTVLNHSDSMKFF